MTATSRQPRGAEPAYRCAGSVSGGEVGADGGEGVGVGGGLVLAVADDPGETQGHAAGVAGGALDAVEGDLDDLLGPDVDDVALAVGLQGEEPLGLPGQDLVGHPLEGVEVSTVTKDSGGMTTRAYLRISLATAASGSIQKQRERILAAEKAAGREPDAVVFYTDEGVSGSRDVERPGRDRLLRDLRKGDRLVSLKIDRLARNVRDLLAIADHVESVGASLVLVDDAINTDGPMGRFLLVLLGALAEFEAATTSERVKASRESFLEAGRHAAGKLPFGFCSVPNPDGSGLVVAVDPEDGPRLRQAVMRVIAGESQNSVRRSIGVSKTGMHKLLHNPRLYGATPVDGGVLLGSDGQPRINPEAAILSLTEWQQLRDRLDKPEKAWHRQTGYGRALACGVCGQRMYVNLNKRNPAYATYRCRKTMHAPGDGSVSVMRDGANEFVEGEFLRRFGDQPYRVTTLTNDSTARQEAVLRADLRIEELTRRMRAADRGERRALNDALMVAYDQRDDALAVPDEQRQTVTDTGRTLAEVWADSDDALRERLILALGRFEVVPGTRGRPIDERVRWVGVDAGAVTVDGERVTVGLSDEPEAVQPALLGTGSRLAPERHVEVAPERN